MKTTAKITATLLVLALVGSTSARVITVEVEGVVDYFATDGGLALDGSVGLGSAMTGYCTYDTETPDLGSGSYAVISISMTIGNYTFTHDPTSSDPAYFMVGTVDPGYSAMTDSGRFDGTVTINESGPLTYDEITWNWTYMSVFHLRTSSSEYIPTDALPDLDSWPDLSIFDMVRGFETRFDGEGDDYFHMYGEITSLVVIPYQPKTYYVNAAEGSDNNDGLSPETPFATIQKAIDTAFDGDTVLVADGTYTGPGNRDIDFLGKAITVRSESGPENCIIDCNATEDARCRGFNFDDGEDANSVLDGFTITNGEEFWGGGISCRESSPTITNCIIINNTTANGRGGGIYCEHSNPTITNCIISGNSDTPDGGGGGGICCWDDSNPMISKCTITDNSTADYGGGIVCWRDSSPTITNCTISGNSATNWGGGGIYCYKSSPTITNCTISGNTAEGGRRESNGGGIYCYESDPNISNCTISGNSAEYSGGGIFCIFDTSPTLTNCILWANTAAQGNEIYLASYTGYLGRIHPSTLIVSYSDVEGGSREVYVEPNCVLNWALGNIDADPRFVEPGYWADANDPNIIVEPNDPNAIWIGGDYHLLRTSPCIDSGDNNSVPADIHDLDGDGNTAEPLPFDLDGNPRFVDRPDIEDTGNGTPPIVDMGAYEAMVSCFGVNHVKLGTKAGKKGNKVEVKGTFDPASPIDFAVDDVTYTIDDGLGYMLTFIIPAGSFEPEGKPDKQKFRFHSAKGSQPGIKARFDFLKCKFELKVKGVIDTSEITADTLAIVLQAGANLVEEVVQVQAKPKHLEFKREPKLNCCQM